MGTEVFRAARRTVVGASPWKTTAKRTPGKLLTDYISKIKDYLLVRGDIDDSTVLPPVVTAYLITVLSPSMGSDLSARTSGELRSLAEALDLLIQGKVAEAADTLTQRFKCVEMASTEGCAVARHLELTPSLKVSSVPEDERDAAIRRQREEVKATWVASAGRGDAGGRKGQAR